MKKTISTISAFLACTLLLLACCVTLASCGFVQQMSDLTQDIGDAFSGLDASGNEDASQSEPPTEENETPVTPTPQEPTTDEQDPPPVTTGPGYDEEGRLVDPDEALCALLYDAAINFREEVDISHLNYTSDKLEPEVERFFFTNPELFYVDNGYSILSNAQSEVQKIKLRYLYSTYSVPMMLAEYEQTIDQIVSGVPADGTDFDKLLYLHDYLVQNYAYDYEGLRTEMQTGQSVAVRDAYRFFKGKVGVCQAYMLALIALCDEVNIPCLPVTSEELQHAWNLVKLDGEWYHVDVTWDDAGGEQSAVYPSYVSYQYFLLSGEALYSGAGEARKPRQEQWKASERANSDKYDDALWRSTTTRMVKYDEDYLCVIYDKAAGAPKIYRGSPVQLVAVKTLDNVKWHSQNPSSYYQQSWVSIVVWENRIVLNTATSFLYYDAEENTLTTAAQIDLENNKQIFGICGLSADGTITCVVARDYRGEFEKGTWKIPAE